MNEKERVSVQSQSESIYENSLLEISGCENSVQWVKRQEQATPRPTELSNKTEEGSVEKFLNRKQVPETEGKI